jgi:hypothetical protein
LKQLNGIGSQNLITVGQKLRILMRWSDLFNRFLCGISFSSSSCFL